MSRPFVHPLHPFVAFREQPNHDVSASSLLLATKGRASSDHQTCISRKRMAWTGDSEVFVIATRWAIAARTIASITKNALVIHSIQLKSGTTFRTSDGYSLSDYHVDG